MTGAANDSPAGPGGRTGRSGEEERMLTQYPNNETSQVTGQQLRHVYRLALSAIPDLVATAGAIGHDNGVRSSAHGRQQAELGHLHGHRMVLCLVAKAAGHAAATG
ncbi:MAG: hypothetical protein RJA56_1204, partial [Pseudomonadota bacterium]